MALILKATGRSFIKTLRGKGQPGRIIGQGVHLKRGDTISSVLADHPSAKGAGYIWSTKIPPKYHTAMHRTGEDGVVLLECLYVPGTIMKILPGETVDADSRNAVAAPARSTNMAAFMKGFGCLKGKEAFAGDAVEFQREMREEWR